MGTRTSVTMIISTIIEFMSARYEVFMVLISLFMTILSFIHLYFINFLFYYNLLIYLNLLKIIIKLKMYKT